MCSYSFFLSFAGGSVLRTGPLTSLGNKCVMDVIRIFVRSTRCRWLWALDLIGLRSGLGIV